MSVSATRIWPASARSSPPSTCSSVLFPTPDAPTTATISPGSTLSARSRNTWRRCAPTSYDLLRPLTSTNAITLFGAERLNRIQRRRLARRIDRGEEANQDRGDDDSEQVPRQHDERDVRDLIDVHRNLNQLVPVEDPAQRQAAQRAYRRPDDADHQALHHEDAHHPLRRGPHRLEDGDVPALLPHQQNERRDDVQRTDHDDQTDGDRDRHFLQPERREQ